MGGPGRTSAEPAIVYLLPTGSAAKKIIVYLLHTGSAAKKKIAGGVPNANSRNVAEPIVGSPLPYDNAWEDAGKFPFWIPDFNTALLLAWRFPFSSFAFKNFSFAFESFCFGVSPLRVLRLQTRI